MFLKKKNNLDEIRVACTGGGTGGHIYPGLAVVDELRMLCTDRKLHVCWIGSSSGMDRTLVEKSGSVDVFYGVPSGKLRRYFSLRTITDVFKIIAGFFCAVAVLRKEHPDVLFSKGGFVSVPPCYAAWCLKIPVYTHECDFSPGLATRLNSKVAEKICISYADTIRFFRKNMQNKILLTGNPVRPVFYSASKQRGLQFLGLSEKQVESKPLLLILGGSSGAVQLNNLVAENLEWLCSRFIIVHQTGSAHQAEIPAAVSAEVQSEYHPYQFIYKEMPDVLAAADVVLSRAGANSLAEFIVLHKPMVLIPLSGRGTRGDQVENADFLNRQGAALVLNAASCDSVHLRHILEQMRERSFRASCSFAVSKIAGSDRPAHKIAELLLAVNK